MPKIFILRGLPASGKSTLARKIVDANPTHTARFNWDDIRNMMGPYWIPERENTKVLYALRDAFINNMMSNQWDIVIDNMNLNPKELEHYNKIVSEYNSNHTDKYEIEVTTLFTPVEECVRRDALRSNPIGESVIRSIWQRYRNFLCTEENKEIVSKLKPATNLPKAVIFDADSTLCFNISGRPYYGTAQGLLDDVPNVNAIIAAQVYHSGGIKVLLVTGREGTDEIKEATQKWMENNQVPIDEYYFRPVNNRESGDKIKAQIISGISNKYNIIGIYEDSSKIVKSLREMGYTVFQPN